MIKSQTSCWRVKVSLNTEQGMKGVLAKLGVIQLLIVTEEGQYICSSPQCWPIVVGQFVAVEVANYKSLIRISFSDSVQVFSHAHWIAFGTVTCQ